MELIKQRQSLRNVTRSSTWGTPERKKSSKEWPEDVRDGGKNRACLTAVGPRIAGWISYDNLLLKE